MAGMKRRGSFASGPRKRRPPSSFARRSRSRPRAFRRRASKKAKRRVPKKLKRQIKAVIASDQEQKHTPWSLYRYSEGAMSETDLEIYGSKTQCECTNVPLRTGRLITKIIALNFDTNVNQLFPSAGTGQHNYMGDELHIKSHQFEMLLNIQPAGQFSRWVMKLIKLAPNYVFTADFPATSYTSIPLEDMWPDMKFPAVAGQLIHSTALRGTIDKNYGTVVWTRKFTCPQRHYNTIVYDYANDTNTVVADDNRFWQTGHAAVTVPAEAAGAQPSYVIPQERQIIASRTNIRRVFKFSVPINKKLKNYTGGFPLQFPRYALMFYEDMSYTRTSAPVATPFISIESISARTLFHE